MNHQPEIFLRETPPEQTQPFIEVVDHFLDLNVCDRLVHFGKARQDEFRSAQVGRGFHKREIKEIRRDHIYWIDHWNTPELELIQSKLSNLALAFKKQMLPIKRFESHLALYRPGDFYIRHRDQHKTSPHRLITAVMYLSRWEKKNEGELVIYLDTENKKIVEPQKGRLVLFESQLEHEVLTTESERWSLTTWFRDDLTSLPVYL